MLHYPRLTGHPTPQRLVSSEPPTRVYFDPLAHDRTLLESLCVPLQWLILHFVRVHVVSNLIYQCPAEAAVVGM